MIKRSIPALIDGVVIDTSDPQEMGRFKVWCPAIDGDNPNIKNLPWVMYASPLAGQAHDFPAGGSSGAATGPVSYGFWAVPKIGARVIVGFLYDDYNQRVYMGSLFPMHGNRSLPNGRNADNQAPTSDTLEKIEPMDSNLKAQFQNDLANSISRTRGAYERQAAQAGDTKTAEEGYGTRVVKSDEPDVGTLDPQTYCITTPGRHSIIMQDDPKFGRVRVKTAEGHQVIFDDVNERIYVSTAHGKSWFEMDLDGHVHVYGAESISMSAGGDFNIQAKGSVTISAGKDINIGAVGYARVSACKDVSMSSDGAMNLTSGAAFNILASGNLLQTAPNIHLNGPKAEKAPCAAAPTIVPSHEPWNRPASKLKRGTNWKA